MKAAENQDFISQGSTNNATCFLGPHRIYDPFTKSFMNLVPGQGHVRRNRCSRIRHRSTLRSPPLRLLRSLAPTRFQAMRAGVGECARLLLPAPLCDAVLTPSQPRSGECLAQDGARHARAAGAGAALADGVQQALKLSSSNSSSIADKTAQARARGGG